jgi:D-sedoheptulose 7-phosphate isomerase
VAVDYVDKYIDDMQTCLSRLPVRDIQSVIAALQEARFNDRQVFILGNGGSAATASHFACDLGKGTSTPDLPRFRVIALTDNMATFSAYANDVGYDCVFAEQLANLLRPGDVVLGISGSGNSANVLRAFEFARSRGALTIGFSGFDGGMMRKLSDVCVIVPSCCMEQVEDVHLILEHLVCSALRKIGAAETYAAALAAVRPDAQPAGGDGH